MFGFCLLNQSTGRWWGGEVDVYRIGFRGFSGRFRRHEYLDVNFFVFLLVSNLLGTLNSWLRHLATHVGWSCFRWDQLSFLFPAVPGSCRGEDLNVFVFVETLHETSVSFPKVSLLGSFFGYVSLILENIWLFLSPLDLLSRRVVRLDRN
jgi:hypothetical protein